MKHLTLIENYQSEDLPESKIPEAFMQILYKGLKISFNNVKDVDAYNKYMVLHMKNGEKIRLDITAGYV